MVVHRGEEFKQLQRETYDHLHTDLALALRKIHNPFQQNFENRRVSLALATGFDEIMRKRSSLYPFPFRFCVVGQLRSGSFLSTLRAVETLLRKTPLCRYADYVVVRALSGWVGEQ